MGRAEQIERRRRRGRSESYEIEAQGEHPVRSRFLVRGPSGRGYEVTLWEPSAEIQHCTCPDFQTNALGTCKHIEAVLHFLGQHHESDLEAAREAPDPEPLLYLHAQTSPPQARLYGGEALGDAAQTRRKALFDDEGLLSPDADPEAIAALLDEAEELGIRVAPEARTFLEEHRARLEREQDLQRAVETFASYRESLVARQEQGVKPDPADEPRSTWVKRFADLEPWAIDGAEHLVRGGRAVLADEPEIDKIRQTLAATEFLRLTGRAERILVGCPPSRRHLWRAAIRMRSGIEPRIIGGVTFEELARAEAASAYCVVTYNRLYRNLEKLQATDWDVLVLDEVQRIKSWPAPTGQAIKSLRTPHAFVLSTGHLEARPQDFFYTIQLLDPFLLGPAWQFLERHVLRDARGAAVGAERMDRALEEARHLWLRRSASDLHLSGPARKLELFVDVTHAQHRQLDPVLRTLLAMTRSQQVWSPEERAELVRLLERLRTVCTAPELVKPEHPGSPKLDELTHLIEDLCCSSPRKIAVFCREDNLGEVMAHRLEHLSLSVTRLEASMSRRDRQARVSAIAKKDEGSVLILSDAAADGLDLKAVTEVAVHAELPWHPTRYQQRRDRIGAGADDGCALEVQLLCTSTPEHAAAEALRRRGDQLSKLVTDPERELKSLLDAEEWQLRELIELVVDERMVLRPKKALLAGKPVATTNRPFTLRGLKQKERNRRVQTPQQRYLLRDNKEPRPAEPAPSRVTARPERPLRAAASRSPAAPQPSAKAAAQAGDVLILGLETREDRLTCTQPSKVHTLGLAMAVTYSFRTSSFTAWRSEYINDLVRALLAAKLVVGYNPHGFEYKILGPYTGRNLSRVPTVDLLLEITKAVGKKLPFDLITGPTLSRPWSADRSQASSHFKNGEVRQVAALCTEGVKVVRDLFLRVAEQGKVLIQTAPNEPPKAVEVDLGAKLNDDTRALLRLP